jgi:hypothetical protein
LITDETMRRQLTQSALSRDRRIIVPLEPARLDALKRELQQLGSRFRLGPD